jgi:hypothetical protein
MNFKEFVETGKLEKFRKIKLDLTENDSEVDELIGEVDDELLKLRNVLNSKLKKDYRGKLKIDFCLTEYINKNKYSKKTERVRDNYQKFILEANEIMAKAKTELERTLSKEVKK